MRKLERFAFAGILAAGAALRLWQYFARTSLWRDELALVDSILGRPLRSLLGEPLLHDQTAPPGFLLAMRAATAVFGQGELALRLFPIVCALASLALFAAVARRALDSRGALLATTFFALGIPFLRYGSEAKQYATDVAVALLLTLCALALPAETSSSTPFWRAGLLGAVAVWFSQPAIFVLAGLALALAADRMMRRGLRGVRPLLPTISLWALASAASVAWNLHRVPAEVREFLGGYWASGFPTLAWKNRFGAYFLLNRLGEFWGQQGMRYPLPGLFVALGTLGFLAMLAKSRKAAFVLFAPALVTFGAALARLYPFQERLILFLGPAFLLAAASGASLLIAWLARVRVPPVASAALFALWPLLALARHPPVYSIEEPRPLFEQLARRRQAGDGIYIFHGMRLALDYYGPRTGLDPAGVTVGGCHRGDLPAYLRELDAFRGRPRVWILVAHHQRRLHELDTIRAYCSRIGQRRESVSLPEEDGDESALELYDLSEPARLAAADADTFPVPPVDLVMARHFSCQRH